MRIVLTGMLHVLALAAASGQPGPASVQFERAGTPNAQQVLSVVHAPGGTVFAADYGGLFRSTDSCKTWTLVLSTYPREVAAGPAGELYVVSPASVLKSTDSGSSWQTLRARGVNEFFSLAVLPTGAVLVGERGGVFRSAAGDTAWTQSLAGGVISSLLYVRPTGELFAADNSVIYRSSDAGSSWSAEPVDTLDGSPYELGADSIGTLYAATSPYGLYRSTTSGATWSPAGGEVTNQDVVSVAADTLGRIYAGLRTGVLTSDDRGTTWSPCSPATTVPSIYDIALADPDRLFVASAFGLLHSSDRGATWAQASPRPGVESVSRLAFSRDGWLYAATSGGVHRSSDQGSSWTPVSAGFTTPSPQYLALNSRGEAYAGAWTDNFRSTDGGGIWERLLFTDTLSAASVYDMIVTRDDHLLAASSMGILRSGDGGASWARIDSGLTNTPLVLAEHPAGRLYAGCRGSSWPDYPPMPSPPLAEVFASDDGGLHWRAVHSWFASGPPTVVTSFAFADSGAVLVGTSNGLHVLTNDDRDVASFSLSSGISAVAVDSQDFWYGAGSAGIFRSTDRGRSWQEFMTNLGFSPDVVTSITVHPEERMFITAAGGIIRSTGPMREFPEAVVLASPADRGAAPGDTLRLEWHASGPAVTRYWVEVATDSLLQEKRVDSLVTDTTSMLTGLLTGRTYWWRVRALNRNGWGAFSDTWQFLTGTTAVVAAETRPAVYRLHQNYPNPFNPSTIIRFDLPSDSHVSLKVYSATGQEVAVLLDARKPAGAYMLRFDGAGLPSGTYFCRMRAGSYTTVRKLLLLK